MADKAVGMADLAPIGVEDAHTIRAAAEDARVKSIVYYAPHLHFAEQSKTQMLLWERHAGSILVYQVRRHETDPRMKLYFPPLPFNPAALRHGLRRMRDFNGDRLGGIVFVQESDALLVAREGLAISLKWEEYIFDRTAVMALEGSGFKKLRQELSGALRVGQVETRPYTMADRPACLALTEAWRERLIANGMKVGSSYRYTHACLTAADRFPPSLLKGLVVEVGGEVRGFGFGGPITSILGGTYLCITDLNVRGLAYLVRHRLMAEFPDLPHFNDSHDAGRPGLRELKQRFRPVEMHGVYKARE
jgi:hypothetical protein